MNNRESKSDGLRNIFLLCFFLCAVFYVFNSSSKEKGVKAKTEKQQEYVSSYHSPFISEKHEIKIPPLQITFSAAALKDKHSDNETLGNTISASENNFSRVKILLKQNCYNLYFASGFHEPPLAA